jgi:hypothetical protein
MGQVLRRAGNSALALVVAGGFGFGTHQAVSVAAAQGIDPGCTLVGGGDCDTGSACLGDCTPFRGQCEYYTYYDPPHGWAPGCSCDCILET